jgi:hypothetical protein
MQQEANTKTFYEALLKLSQPYIVDGLELHKFIGAPTSLFYKTCPNGHYGTCARNLRNMGCTIQLSRGGGTGPGSEWLLIKHPDEVVDHSTLRGQQIDGIYRTAGSTSNSTEGQLRTLHNEVAQMQRNEVVSAKRHRQTEEYAHYHHPETGEAIYLMGRPPEHSSTNFATDGFLPTLESPNPKYNPTNELQALVNFKNKLEADDGR